MERKYWESQVDIITTLEKWCGEIATLKITDEDMVVVVPLFDECVIRSLDKICEQAELQYVYKPHTITSRRHKTKPGVLFKFYKK